MVPSSRSTGEDDVHGRTSHVAEHGQRERPVSAYTSCVPSKNNSMHKQGEGAVAPVSNLVIKTPQEETYHLEHEERKARQGGPNSTVDVIRA